MRAAYILFLLLPVFSFLETPADRLQVALTGAMSGKEGAAVVLEVETGRILASYRIDVAARRLVSPGSTVKPLTLLALLDARLVTETTAVFCPVTVRLAGRTLDCSHDPEVDSLDPVSALAHSCNHFFIHTSQLLPVDALYRAFSAAGLNSPTGKWQSEVPGVLQQPEGIEELQLMSIGEQGVQVTPLGLAEAYRMLARRLLKAEDMNAGLQLVSDGLEAAVELGTAQLAASQTMRVAGKTGTSAGHAWFAGYAPAERPEIVVVIFLEQGGGGRDAAPVAGPVFAAHTSSKP